MFRVDINQDIANEFRHMPYLFRGTKHWIKKKIFYNTKNLN